MENGEWVHYPAKPGHWGSWEYEANGLHYVAFVNYNENYGDTEGAYSPNNTIGWAGVCEKGHALSLCENGNRAKVLDKDHTWPEFCTPEHACVWLEQLFLTGAWKDYVEKKD